MTEIINQLYYLIFLFWKIFLFIIYVTLYNYIIKIYDLYIVIFFLIFNENNTSYKINEFHIFKSVSKSLSLSLHSTYMLEMKLSVCKLDENEKSDRAKLVIHRIISGITQPNVPRGIHKSGSFRI